jgi:hypothetical protein
MPTRYFVTIDAETEVLADGIAAANTIRERVERTYKVRIPIVWFIRFQRTFTESVEKDSLEYFSRPMDRCFDGFALGKRQLREFQARGDEIAWHYHAYNYVYRDDLSHEHKLALLRADLLVCGAEMARRYPEFEMRSFRFGWCFIPDYSLYPLLNRIGIRIDASVRIDRGGKKMGKFNVCHPPSITQVPKQIDGTWFVPVTRPYIAHDHELVAHHFDWSVQDEEQASRMRDAFEAEVVRIACEARTTGASFATYKATFL